MCAVLPLIIPQAIAQDRDCTKSDIDHDEALRLTTSGAILPLERVISIAQAAHPGKLFEASLTRYHHQYVYSIEILDERDRVWNLMIDAVNGKHINP